MPGERPQHRAHREVRRRPRVLTALHAEERELVFAVAQLLEQPGLARARLADQLDDPAASIACRCGRREQDVELLVAPDQRECADADPTFAGRARRPRRESGTFLPFTRNGSRASSSKRVSDRSSTRAGCDELPRLRLLHQARGQVHRVAHHRERPAGRRTEVPDEDRAAVDTDP